MTATQPNRLSSSEIANLWNIYMIESLLIPFKKPLIRASQQPMIRSVVEVALGMSMEYVERIAELFRAEGLPVPRGFSDDDMNLEAPALYTDNYTLRYIHEMAKLGLHTVPQAAATSNREDVLDFLRKAYEDYDRLYRQSLELLIARGIYAPAPPMPSPEPPEYIQGDSYFSGLFGPRRPMNAMEIMNVHYTIHENAVSKVLLRGFAQTARDPELRDHFDRGARMAADIIDELEKLLSDERISLSPTYDSELLPSNVPLFSDKLMLATVTQMGSGSLAIYGIRLSMVHRSDLSATFMKMIKNALLYAEDGVDLLVKRRWLEQPPTPRAAPEPVNA